MAARHEEGCYEKHIFVYFLVWKGLLLLSSDGVGVARGATFQEIRPGAGFQTAISLKKSRVGYRSKTLKRPYECIIIASDKVAHMLRRC